MGRRMRVRPAGPIYLIGLVLATMLTLAACGSPSATPGIASANQASPGAGATPTATASGKGNADGLKFAQCMRQHGVQMEDPVDGRIEIKSGPGQEATMQAAQKACSQYAPGAGGKGAGPGISKQDQAKLLKFTQCMRQHGVPMADPDFSGGGVKMAIGGSARVADAKVKAAQQACAKLMPAGMGDGPSTSTGGGAQTGQGASQ